MANDDSDLLARIARMETLLNEIKAMLLAMRDRATTAEQGLGAKWFR